MVKTTRTLVEARELHAPVIKHFRKRKIIARGIDDVWGCDILEILPQYMKLNGGFRYILNCIDNVSKIVYSEPLRKKNALQVSAAFERILKKSGRKPNLLHTDEGREFLNRTFQTLLDRYGITKYHTFSKEKSAMVERFHRTLN